MVEEKAQKNKSAPSGIFSWNPVLLYAESLVVLPVGYVLLPSIMRLPTILQFASCGALGFLGSGLAFLGARNSERCAAKWCRVLSMVVGILIGTGFVLLTFLAFDVIMFLEGGIGPGD